LKYELPGLPFGVSASTEAEEQLGDEEFPRIASMPNFNAGFLAS
jgi:hypothetical protein